MTDIGYSVSNTEETKAAVIILDGEPHTVGSTHAKYDEIVQTLYQEVGLAGTISEELSKKLIALIDAETGINSSLTAARLSDRIIVSNGRVLFNGEVQDGTITEQLVRLYIQGDEKGYKALTAFIERVYDNPSEVSRQHLYDFLAHHRVTITDEGYILGYKSVNNDYLSVSSGAGIVTWPDGRIEEFDNARLPNNPGNIVSIPRVLVDEDRNSACSVGLHIGAYSYAKSFSQKLLYVLVNPRDVVAVPHDVGSAKVRVSQYRVLSDNEHGEYEDGYIAAADLTALTGVANVSEDVFPNDEDEDDYDDGFDPDEDDYLNELAEDDELGVVEDIYGETHTGVLTDTLTPEDRKTVDELKTLVNSVVASGWTESRTLSAYGSKKLSKRRRPLWHIAVTEMGLKLN